jgi:2'-5' RNA ligase
MPENTSTVIVALPAADSPIHDIGPEQKHATLVFLGEVDSAEGIADYLADVAPLMKPFRAGVERLEHLGDDDPQAEVVLLSTDSDIQSVRTELLNADAVREPFEAIKQWPLFTPHVTLGYGDEVTDEDRAAAAELPEIHFDRLALWHRDEQTEFQLGAAMTDEEATEVTEEPVAPMPWFGVLAPEGKKSGDRRRFREGSLRMRSLPLPLTWQKVSGSGHDGSVTVAKIEKVWRQNGLVWGSGHALQTPEADEWVALVGEFGRYGVSIDADDLDEFAIEEMEDGTTDFLDARVCSASTVSIPAFAEAFVALGEFSEEALAQVPVASHEIPDGDAEEFRDVSPEERKRLADSGAAMPDGSYPIANCGDLKNAIQAIGRAKDPAAVKRHIRKRKSALGCPDIELPEDWALEDAEALADLTPGTEGNSDTDHLPSQFPTGGAMTASTEISEVEVGIEDEEKVASLTASAPRTKPPREWFSDPGLDQPTAITITEDGQIYGHLAEWGVCHIGFDGECVEPPHSVTNYAYFCNGVIETDDGQVPVGSISLGGGHAGPRKSWRAATEHYDSTSAVIADVAAGEDTCGIWVAGALRDGVTDAQVAELLASGGLSGDWREVRRGSGQLELIHALAVNAGGFPIPRLQVASSGGHRVAMVAAGIVTNDSTIDLSALTDEVLARIEERAEAKRRTQALRHRTHGDRIEGLKARLGEE